VGRGAMGNPWFFRSIAALARGEADPGPPTMAERQAVWLRHALLVWEYSVERMRVHELRKTVAWYSRGLRGGADLRTRVGMHKDPKVIMAMGEEFFAELQDSDVAHERLTRPADPIAKSLARHERSRGGHAEADEPCASA
jgi:tRNA-dihydrouridine synthase